MKLRLTKVSAVGASNLGIKGELWFSHSDYETTSSRKCQWPLVKARQDMTSCRLNILPFSVGIVENDFILTTLISADPLAEIAYRQLQ